MSLVRAWRSEETDTSYHSYEMDWAGYAVLSGKGFIFIVLNCTYLTCVCKIRCTDKYPS